MKDAEPVSEEVKNHIQKWIYILLMREYGYNTYNEDSFPLKVFECKTIAEVDEFFTMVLDKSTSDNRALASLKSKEAKIYEVKSR